MSAFAALSLLCIASSCRDQDFDWDQAHAISTREVFTDVFIKNFGKPQAGHQWGFDMPWDGKVSTKSMTRAERNLIYKFGGSEIATMVEYSVVPESTKENIIANPYSSDVVNGHLLVPNITEKESWEVYEWFSTHWVDWTNTTSIVGYYNGESKDNAYFDSSKHVTKLYDNSENEVTPTSDGTALVSNGFILKNESLGKDDISNRIYGNYVINKVDPSVNAASNAIVRVVYFDGKNSTKKTSDGIAHKMCELSTGNSLKTYMTGDLAYWLNNPYVGLTIDIDAAWLQHVANDPYGFDNKAPNFPGKTNMMYPTQARFDACSNKSSGLTFHPYDENGQETSLNGGGNYSKSNMDQAYIFESSGNNAHSLDWNNGTGYGYPSHVKNGFALYNGDIPVNNCQISQNGTLAVGVNLNNFVYQSSVGGSLKHDKWIIVYLKGEDYEGWYLGCDLEGYSSKGSDINTEVAANGYCNDWIIKLTACGVSNVNRQGRLMCEDLGAIEKNSNGSDIDYNDIVLDVNYSYTKGVSLPTNLPSGVTIPSGALSPSSNGANKISSATLNLTAQAAGGTLPLIVGYDNTTLFEVHELLLQQKTYFTNGSANNNHTIDAGEYGKMINTGAPVEDSDREPSTALKGVDRVSAQTFTVNFFNNGNVTGNFAINTTAKAPADWDELINKVNIKVYRLGAEDYKNNSNNKEDALWVNLKNGGGDNSTSDAPVMLCVPQTTKWLKERHKISDGYTLFPTWVANQDAIEWVSPQNATASHLYNAQ